MLRGKLISSNEIWGGQAETQRWALRWYLMAFGAMISQSKQEIKATL